MAQFSSFPLRSALDGWRTLAKYIDKPLGAGDEIFGVEAHDNLIFDDDLYTRSRRYFWVINCLNDSETSLEYNVQVWTNYRDWELLPFGQELLAEGNVEMNKELHAAIGKCDEVQVKLEQVKKQFNEQRAKAVALRDGSAFSLMPSLPLNDTKSANTIQPLSASAVMEPRAPTRPGENVKPLTYVSIFYPPLAFCTVSRLCLLFPARL
jgi:hypothetical protein